MPSFAARVANIEMNLLTGSDAIRSHLDKVLHRLDVLATERPVKFNTFGKEQTVEEIVGTILKRVRNQGDSAVAEIQNHIDGSSVKGTELCVTESEFEQAERETPESIKKSLSLMKDRIADYAQGMMPEAEVWYPKKDGRQLGYKFSAIESIGAYVPGGLSGSTPLISTVLMNLIPAKVAGVSRIVVSTPCRKDGSIHPYLLTACRLAGADHVYRSGGAQGVAAMAFGTASLPACQKIIGPGNVFVQEAKRQVFGRIDIDMMAGPSEIAIIADQSAKAKVLAADMIAQAEHDPLAASILFSTEETLLKETLNELKSQCDDLPKSDIARDSLKSFGALCLCKTLDEACQFSNHLAPEHLELACDNPKEILKKIRHAGAIFLGHFSPEVVGDYTAGPSHTLPTCGAAKFSSGITVFSFLKSSSLIEYDEEAMIADRQPLTDLARAENLEGHARSLTSRTDQT